MQPGERLDKDNGKKSAREEGTLTTEEVRAHFARKHEKDGVLA